MDKQEAGLILEIGARLAAGILSGSGVSHQDTAAVSRLAIKHARALVAEFERSEVEEKARVEAAERQAEADKKAAAAAVAAEKERAAEEKEAQEKLQKSEHGKHR